MESRSQLDLTGFRSGRAPRVGAGGVPLHRGPGAAAAAAGRGHRRGVRQRLGLQHGARALGAEDRLRRADAPRLPGFVVLLWSEGLEGQDSSGE